MKQKKLLILYIFFICIGLTGNLNAKYLKEQNENYNRPYPSISKCVSLLK